MIKLTLIVLLVALFYAGMGVALMFSLPTTVKGWEFAEHCFIALAGVGVMLAALAALALLCEHYAAKS